MPEPSSNRPEGPLLPVLREAAWPHVAGIVHRPLLDVPGDVPWVTYGIDLGDRIARVPPSWLDRQPLPELEAEAMGNLAERPLKIRSLSEVSVAVFGEYGSEAILLPDILRQVAERLGAELIAIGVPKEGGFMAHDATRLREVTALTRWSREEFDAARCRRISPLPLLVQDGRVTGFVAPQPDGETARPWWRFW